MSETHFSANGADTQGDEGARRPEEYHKKIRRGEIPSNELRLKVLQEHEGCCYVCGIEEWRLGKRLHMHRIVAGKDGGLYVIDNVLPLCHRCHRRCEGLTREEILAQHWRKFVDSDENSRDDFSLLALLADDGDVILYRPKLNTITGGVLASLMLRQAIYWWAKSKRRPFYKFAAPCSHERYAEGDSWQEELGFTRYEFEGALKRLGQRVKKGQSRPDALAGHFLIWWQDNDRKTWYELNEAFVSARLKQAYSASANAENYDAGKPYHTDAEKPHQSHGGKPHLISDEEKPHPLISETTTETTPETTYNSPPKAGEEGAKDSKEKEFRGKQAGQYGISVLMDKLGSAKSSGKKPLPLDARDRSIYGNRYKAYLQEKTPEGNDAYSVAFLERVVDELVRKACGDTSGWQGWIKFDTAVANVEAMDGGIPPEDLDGPRYGRKNDRSKTPARQSVTEQIAEVFGEDHEDQAARWERRQQEGIDNVLKNGWSRL